MNSLIYHYETTDSNGTRLVFVGDNLPPQFADMENLAYSIHGDLSAHTYIQYMADKDVNTVFFNYVQDHLLKRKLDLSPREGLQYALSVGIIRLTKHEVADDKNDEQTQLRIEIQQTLNQIVVQEKNQTKILQQQLEQETTTTQVLIYTGAFMQGIGSSVWGLATWVKEVSDVVNPVVIAYNSFKAATASYGNDNQFSDELLKLQYRELVQALGFDPSQISQEQLKIAFETLEVVWADNDLKKRLTVFCKEYAQAQHSITITNVAGSAVFEITLAVIILAATGGAGLMPAFASKGHLIRSFNKLGDLLLTFGKQNKKPHAEQKATNDYEQAVLEPAHVQKLQNPPKQLQKNDQSNSKVISAQARQQKMLDDNIGYNISPTAWDNYPMIGRNGTFVSDKQSITDALGNLSDSPQTTITKGQAQKIEKDFGLESGSLQQGFKIRKVDNLRDSYPRSPLEGNQYFLGPGQHLPNGAPELVIKSIPTADNKAVQTIIEVKIK